MVIIIKYIKLDFKSSILIYNNLIVSRVVKNDILLILTEEQRFS